MSKIEFNKHFQPCHGECVQISESIHRITANNPGPFTFTGTNTYIVGSKSVAVIDPGPADEEHISGIVKAAEPDSISHIFITHTHKDHSPGAKLLKQLTGAQIVGAGPHKASRELKLNESNLLDSSADTDFQPDLELHDTDVVEGGDWTLETVATPGHTSNHLSFALREENVLFSGDHVMAWSTTIVAPPDGSMGSYMDSLEKLKQRTDKSYLPGHGGPVENPTKYVDDLTAHRISREKALVGELGKGPNTIPKMVEKIYSDTPKFLHGAAALSMLAQLEYLIERNLVSASDETPLEAEYRLI